MKIKYLPSIVLAIAIAVLSLMPAKEFPQVDVPFADKWVHWVMYGVLAAVLIWDCRKGLKGLKGSKGLEGSRWFNAPRVRSIVAAMVAASLYGGLMEILQATATTTRSGDWLDFLADTFGALCVGVVFFILRSCSLHKA